MTYECNVQIYDLFVHGVLDYPEILKIVTENSVMDLFKLARANGTDTSMMALRPSSFSVESAWETIRQCSLAVTWFSFVWAPTSHLTIVGTAWKLVHNSSATGNVLK